MNKSWLSECRVACTSEYCSDSKKEKSSGSQAMADPLLQAFPSDCSRYLNTSIISPKRTALLWICRFKGEVTVPQDMNRWRHLVNRATPISLPPPPALLTCHLSSRSRRSAICLGTPKALRHDMKVGASRDRRSLFPFFSACVVTRCGMLSLSKIC